MHRLAAFAVRPRGGLLLLTLTGALVVPAGLARSDVRPAVEVFILGEPRAAVAGRHFGGTFEFRGTERVVLDSLRLAGERWRVTRFRPPATFTIGPTKRVRVAFRALPSDPLAPLVLEYRAAGSWWRKSFDLSPEAVARARRPGSVTSHPQR